MDVVRKYSGYAWFWFSYIMLESSNYIRIKDRFLWNYHITKKKLIGNVHLKLLFIFNFNKKTNKNFSDFTFY